MPGPNHYLSEGRQTRFTPLVLEHAEKARLLAVPETDDLEEPLSTIYRTCTYIFNLPIIRGFTPGNHPDPEQRKRNREIKDRTFRKRELDEVLREGYVPTCSDIGLLFRGLMAAQGQATAYVETFHEDYLFDRAFHGHVFGRVYHSQGSFIVDPREKPEILSDETDVLPYVIFREGLDSWDIGIQGYEDMHSLRKENLDSLLQRYQINLSIVFERKVRVIQAFRRTISGSDD